MHTSNPLGSRLKTRALGSTAPGSSAGSSLSHMFWWPLRLLWVLLCIGIRPVGSPGEGTGHREVVLLLQGRELVCVRASIGTQGPGLSLSLQGSEMGALPPACQASTPSSPGTSSPACLENLINSLSKRELPPSQRFSNLSLHQNPLEGFINTDGGAHPRLSNSVGLGPG